MKKLLVSLMLIFLTPFFLCIYMPFRGMVVVLDFMEKVLSILYSLGAEKIEENKIIQVCSIAFGILVAGFMTSILILSNAPFWTVILFGIILFLSCIEKEEFINGHKIRSRHKFSMQPPEKEEK